MTGAIIKQLPLTGWLIDATWLFPLWVVLTILFVLDILIPDPIPFIDEFILGILWFGTLVLLFIRVLMVGLANTYDFLVNPGVIAFIITLIVLFIVRSVRGKKHGK